MSRDIDLLRFLLLTLEKQPGLASGKVTSLAERIVGSIKEEYDEHYTAAQCEAHIRLLHDAQLLICSTFTSETVENDGRVATKFRTPEIPDYVFGISWKGYEYLDLIRDPEVWSRTKEGAKKIKGFSFELLGDLAKGFAKTQIKKYTGIESG